ncbi:Uncharacterised protein [uncultured archaeon]|nr:Uncharacterised protein [uncultured archaeon]
MKLKRLSKSRMDLNSIIKIANLIIVLVTIYIYFSKSEANPYIDFTTLVLMAMIGLQIQLILMFEKRSRDPFVLLLAFNITFFYLLRVLTLAYDPWSDVLSRYALTVDDLNLTLLFIFFGVWAIFFGLSLVKFKIHPIEKISNMPLYQNKSLIKPITILLIFILMLIASFYFYFFAGLGRSNFLGYSSWISYISIIINSQVIIILTFAYIITNLKLIYRKYLYSFAILFAIFVLFKTISGSRGGILAIVMAAIFVLLSRENKISIKKSTLALILLIIIPISIVSFGYATYNRSVINLQQTKEIDIGDFISSMSSYQIDNQGTLALTLRPVFNRIGFLDMATDIASNSDKYDKVINFEYYLKSIIDRIGITPGFHVFNTYQAAITLRYIYSNMDIPIIMEDYNSDQFTLFGEYYVLFKGYGSLIVIFVLAYVFKILYLSLKTRDAFSLCFYRAIILYIFYNFWLNSFGTDWLIIETTRLVISSMIFMKIAKIGMAKLNKSSKALTDIHINEQKTVRAES